jgi:hypothetical protein
MLFAMCGEQCSKCGINYRSMRFSARRLFASSSSSYNETVTDEGQKYVLHFLGALSIALPQNCTLSQTASLLPAGGTRGGSRDFIAGRGPISAAGIGQCADRRRAAAGVWCSSPRKFLNLDALRCDFRPNPGGIIGD